MMAAMPKNIEREVMSKLTQTIDKQSDRQAEMDNQKYAYDCIEKLAGTTSLSKNEFEVLKKGMEETYPYDYAIQYKRLKEEVKRYEGVKKTLVEQEKEKIQKVNKENLEAKKILETQKKEIKLPTATYDKLKNAAEKKYPNNFVEQKKYIEQAAEIYNIVK
jgi:hypothetical protein